MLSYRSFIDVLFILLLCTMVMLTQSIRLGAIDTVIARPGAEGISPVRADEVQIIVIGPDELQFEGRSFPHVESMAHRIRPHHPVLLVTTDKAVRHHRVMSVWMSLSSLDLDVKLGVQPAGAGAAG